MKRLPVAITHFVLAFAAGAALSSLPKTALAHAYPDHAEPKVGAAVTASPGVVRIWFDCALRPSGSTLSVRDRQGKIVDKGNSRVNSDDATLLEVNVPKLPPGRYRVLWKAVAAEGHPTAGDYSFTVKDGQTAP